MKGKIHEPPLDAKGYCIDLEGVALALDASTPESPERIVLEVRCTDLNSTGELQNLALTIEDAEFLLETVKDVLDFHKARKNNAN